MILPIFINHFCLQYTAYQNISNTMNQQDLKAFLQANIKVLTQSSFTSKEIDLGYKRLTLSKRINIGDPLHHISQYFNYKSDRAFTKLPFDIKDQLSRTVENLLPKCQIDGLVETLLVIDSYYKCWPTIIPHLSSNCRFIVNLEVVSCKIDDSTMQLISRAEWKFIKKADLSINNISWRGVKHLANCKWKYLKYLKLSDNRIGNKGLCELIKTTWSYLEEVHIMNNSITPDGLKYLKRCQWRRLCCFFLDQRQESFQFSMKIIIPKVQEHCRQKEYYRSQAWRTLEFKISRLRHGILL